MRTCDNCVYQLLRGNQELCIKAGNLCRVARDLESKFCSDHQLNESSWRPLMDESIELLDTVSITSGSLEKKANKIIDAYSHLGIRESFKKLNLKKIRVNLAESEIQG